MSARACAHGSFGVSVPLRMVAGLLDVLLDVRFPSVRLTAAEGCSCPLESVHVSCTTARLPPLEEGELPLGVMVTVDVFKLTLTLGIDCALVALVTKNCGDADGNGSLEQLPAVQLCVRACGVRVRASLNDGALRMVRAYARGSCRGGDVDRPI